MIALDGTGKTVQLKNVKLKSKLLIFLKVGD